MRGGEERNGRRGKMEGQGGREEGQKVCAFLLTYYKINLNGERKWGKQMSHVCKEDFHAHDYNECYFSPGVAPVKQVSPQHASGRPVSPTRPPDILYGPQGQRSNGKDFNTELS